MNLLPCDLNVRISNSDGSYNNHFDISANLNSIVYDLETGSYDIEVRANAECNITTKMMKLPFVAQDKTVRKKRKISHIFSVNFELIELVLSIL